VPHVLDVGGSIETGTLASGAVTWQHIPTGNHSFQELAVSANTIVGIADRGSQQLLWRSRQSTGGWETMDGIPDSWRLAYIDGELWVNDARGAIWRTMTPL
jgi:hypothetical protein